MKRKRLNRSERKIQIKDSAIKLFTEKGYRNTTVQDIVSSASFSKGGFYNIYSSKEELLRDILEDIIDYRKKAFISYINKNKDMNRKDLMIELFLDNILDYHPYKKMFVKLFTEVSNDLKLKSLFYSLEADLTEDFLAFYKKEGLNEYIKLSSEEFRIILSSLMMGNTIFGPCKGENMRNILRDIFTAYFDKIDLFNLELEA